MPISIDVQARSAQQTKGNIKNLRHQGWIPSVIYGNQTNADTLSVSTKTFVKELRNPGIYTRIFDLGSFGKALVKHIQFPPTSDTPIHIDWIRLGARVTIAIPIRFVHADLSPGIKKGGMLNVIFYTLDVSVPSENIPQDLIVDLTGMEIGRSVHLSDVALPNDIKVLHLHADATIASIVAPAGSSDAAKE